MNELTSNWELAQEPAVLSAIEPLEDAVGMSTLARVADVEHLGGRVLRVEFSDGLVRELDFADVLSGILSSIDDDASFAAVTLDPVSGTVSWPNGIDFDPDVLHGEHSAASVG